MKKIVLLLAALTALVAAAPAAAATVNVAITRTGFVPNNVTVKQGDTVTWTNADTQNHQVASQEAAFTSPVLAQNQTFSYTFTKAGKFTVTDPLSRNERMQVTVEEAPLSISLNANRRLVTYGGSVTLSGTLSSQAAGEQVIVEAQACGSTFARVTTAATTTGGAFSVSVKPLKNTTYRVRSRTTTSSELPVRVAPRVTLGKIAPRRFTIRVLASDSFAGKAVSVQRYNTVTKRWVLARYATLRANTSGVAPTVVSSVTFSLKVKAKTRMRVALGAATAGTCYAPGTSNAVVA